MDRKDYIESMIEHKDFPVNFWEMMQNVICPFETWREHNKSILGKIGAPLPNAGSFVGNLLLWRPLDQCGTKRDFHLQNH